ncbi:MAG TPA: hypothetical protein VFJ74_14605 [Gemmatimonadaceae bacterium]|nr:hypothetical protein [Gemmatimonadaceae bacterium]
MRALLVVAATAVYAALATWLARGAGGRWAWAAAAALVLLVAGAGAARVGTANPFSRTARWDPLLFFLMAAVVLAAPAAAATSTAVALAAPDASPLRSALVATLWSAGAALLALPVGYVAAVAVEVLWPH